VTPSAQIAAVIEVLGAIEEAPGKSADAIVNTYFRARRYIGSGDRRAISDRVWTLIRGQRQLQWRLGGAASPRLTVAASLLLEGWTVSGLEQIYSGARFAPAPLTREELGRLGAMQSRAGEGAEMPLPVRLELPDWLLPRLQARFGARFEAETAALSKPAPLDLRVNLLKATREQARLALLEEGLEAEPTPFSPWGLRLAGRHAITSGAAFRQGLVEPQDEGSQLVAALVGARPGMRVLDWCAGAGGKTLALAMTMQNRGRLVACDVSAARLENAVRRLRRAGAHNVERHVISVRDKWRKRHVASFDRVLVDAPCSGTGRWRRTPDARHRLTERGLAEMVARQASILDQVANLVRNRGRLVYATCSLLTEENEAQVSTFLSRHPDFARAGPDLALTPAQHGTDGFYAAVLERAK